MIRNVDFDFVVTPKSGSPLLGYEFAKLVNKPFVLREQTERLNRYQDPRSIFNCAEVPEKGSMALIVDDSTTGGTLLCDTVKDLRKYGYQVNTCLVVFEVKKKDARVRLKKENVQEDGRLELSNNRAERSIKPFVMGRKNWIRTAICYGF